MTAGRQRRYRGRTGGAILLHGVDAVPLPIIEAVRLCVRRQLLGGQHPLVDAEAMKLTAKAVGRVGKILPAGALEYERNSFYPYDELYSHVSCGI